MALVPYNREHHILIFRRHKDVLVAWGKFLKFRRISKFWFQNPWFRLHILNMAKGWALRIFFKALGGNRDNCLIFWGIFVANNFDVLDTCYQIVLLDFVLVVNTDWVFNVVTLWGVAGVFLNSAVCWVVVLIHLEGIVTPVVWFGTSWPAGDLILKAGNCISCIGSWKNVLWFNTTDKACVTG